MVSVVSGTPACLSESLQVKGEVIALDSPSASRRHAAQPIIAVELECVISAVGPNSSGVRALNFPGADEHLFTRWLASGKQHKRCEAAYEYLSIASNESKISHRWRGRAWRREERLESRKACSYAGQRLAASFG